MKISIIKQKADLHTPVSLYLNARTLSRTSCLLESGDNRSTQHATSYICFNPIKEIEITNSNIILTSDNSEKVFPQNSFKTIFQLIQTELAEAISEIPQHFAYGMFGYFGYDYVQVIEDLRFNSKFGELGELPLAKFILFKHVIILDRFKEELYLISIDPDGSESILLESICNNKIPNSKTFEIIGEEYSNQNDEEFLNKIKLAKLHLERGDIFQIVLSRRFKRKYKGDSFSLYRALRALSPSPFLFYFEFNDFALGGASPEAQVLCNDKHATLHPIAGTYPRSGDDAIDQERATKLLNDEKEICEHNMLVDLARNDLAKSCVKIKVDKFAEIQYFSHVIHIVSRISGELLGDEIDLVGNTFPAGTLSGAPKYRAMELIDQLEDLRRQIYGGCLGILGFRNEVLLTIIIRTFLAKDNIINYQAGAGIVFDSNPATELSEIQHKLRAIKNAIELASK